MRLDTEGKPFRAVSPTTVDGKNIGLTPSDIRSAYNIPGLPEGAAVPTIAIVVEGDNPHAENDLHVYRTTFGLSECTIKSGCLRKINAAGGDTLPPVCTDNAGWATEIMNDLEAASAVCPACNLLLIEADDEGGGAHTKYDAIEVAAKLGATVIINSWNNPAAFGSPEIEARLNHPGVFFAGDDGGYCPPPCTDNPNAELPYPASSQYVWAVGGTKLVRDASARGWHETVWNQLAEGGLATGSGCNQKEPQPSWQAPLAFCQGAAKGYGRTTNDVAANADTTSGLVILDTWNTTDGCGSWKVVGGTSLAVALVASIFAVTGNGQVSPKYAYDHPENFHDVLQGDNGCPDGSVICTARKGYDGPTGFGSPNASLMAAKSVQAHR